MQSREANFAERRIWEYLRANGLANTVFDSFDDIVDKSCEAWKNLALAMPGKSNC